MLKFFAVAAAALLFSLVALPGHAEGPATVSLPSLDLSVATQGWGRPQADKSVDGHPLTLGGKTFAQGFGTHAPGILIVDLHGDARRFTATVGVDDETGGKGSAEFQVLGSGHKILWRSGVLRGGQAPKTVDLDLTGVPQIVLRVTDGGDGFEYDHADWADAQLEVTGALPKTLPYLPAEPTIDQSPAPAAPHLHGPALIGIRPATPFLWKVPVTGVRPLTFRATGLPQGLTLNAVTGIITGQMTAGRSAVRVHVQSAAGQDTRTVTLVAGDKIALTPPMGWNSYDAFGDNVTEAEVLANARYVAAKMQPFGWDTVVVDYRWYDPGAHDNNANARAGAALTMDAYGRLLPSPNRFPSATDGKGFRLLADQTHKLGLKFGIHIMRGIPRSAVTANLPIAGSSFTAAEAANTASTCEWCPDMYGVRGDTPAGQAYYDSLFRLYASWGLDFVKVDDISRPYQTAEIDAIRKAIDKCGRSIVLSLSPGETPIADAVHVVSHANLWRVSGDFWDNWQALSVEFELAARWQSFVGSGHWPDADMLPVGHLSVGGRSVGGDRQTNFNHNEQLTLLSFWSLLPAPLMVGANLPDSDAWTQAVLTNPEVIAVNQDAGGTAARRVSQEGSAEVWARPLADGSIAVGLFNRGDFDADLSFSTADLGVSLPTPCTLRDVWQRRSLGAFTGTFTRSVPAHGVAFVRLMPPSI